MFHSVEVETALIVGACVNRRAVLRAYGNHGSQDCHILSVEMDQGQVGGGAYILCSSPYPAVYWDGR